MFKKVLLYLVFHMYLAVLSVKRKTVIISFLPYYHLIFRGSFSTKETTHACINFPMEILYSTILWLFIIELPIPIQARTRRNDTERADAHFQGQKTQS